jgi:hypothetical protein
MLPHLGERDLGDHEIACTRVTARCLSKIAHSGPAVELGFAGILARPVRLVVNSKQTLHFVDCEQF